MAKDNSGQGSWGNTNSYNEVTNTDPNKPDVTGDGIYFDGWDEINKMHLAQTGPMVATANSEEGRELSGGPAKGEPNPAGMPGQKGN
jgi:hypothetical protein